MDLQTILYDREFLGRGAIDGYAPLNLLVGDITNNKEIGNEDTKLCLCKMSILHSEIVARIAAMQFLYPNANNIAKYPIKRLNRMHFNPSKVTYNCEQLKGLTELLNEIQI